MIPHKDFKLISNKKIFKSINSAQKKLITFFCKFCGVKSFYRPRSHQNAFSINYKSIQNPPNIDEVIEFDGINFERNIESIKIR